MTISFSALYFVSKKVHSEPVAISDPLSTCLTKYRKLPGRTLGGKSKIYITLKYAKFIYFCYRIVQLPQLHALGVEMLANFEEVINTCEGSSHSRGVISLCCSVSSSSVGTLRESLGNAGDCVSKGWHLHNLEMIF